jgi:hypothetical protein
MPVALFPLNALVCPGGRLPLRIFEPRYLDMVKRCLKEDSGFVVLLLRNGHEADGGNSPFYEVGTFTKIVDFDQDKDGALTIVAEGKCRVNVSQIARADDGLWMGEIDQLTHGDALPMPDKYEELVMVLRALVRHPAIKTLNLNIDYRDGQQVSWRLTELLPFGNARKQELFEMADPLHRLAGIAEQLDEMSE